MSDGSNFLERWSRRKQEAKRAESPPVAESDSDEHLQEQAVAPEAPVSEATEHRTVTPCELSAEELASLPRIEDVTIETDITQFLRAGVPASLRNAALRRMWALDPAIRDFVGEALDYAYDWNVPGGVPGSGPLLATDDVPGMLRQILGNRGDLDSEPMPEPRAEAFGPAHASESSVASESKEIGAGDPESADPSTTIRERTAANPPDVVSRSSCDEAEKVPGAASSKEISPLRQHRHGGAVPT